MHITATNELPLIGQSPAFLEALDHVSMAAPLSKPILIIGERGTGKELIASRLHYLSRRWDKAFIKLNCATLADSLLESELFGHESGSFTGATKKRLGRFELANDGTLLLDELASTSALVQEKILRVVEYGEFDRVGGHTSVQVDVRIIAATNEDLPMLAKQGNFREDLLDRLAFDVITLPPLRYRKEDILPLAEHFAQRMISELQREYFPGFSRNIINELQEYPWPGNIRELKNVVERAVYRSIEKDATIDTIRFDPFESPYRPMTLQENSLQAPHGSSLDLSEAVDFKSVIQDYEIQLINQSLELNQFNQRKSAEHLGLTYHQLRGYLRKYELLEK